jgi:GNAT superfamily N-acetyltransferase
MRQAAIARHAPAAYSELEVAELLRQVEEAGFQGMTADGWLFVAESHGTLVGTAGWAGGYLRHVHVRLGFERRGIGTRLVRHVEAEVERSTRDRDSCERDPECRDVLCRLRIRTAARQRLCLAPLHHHADAARSVARGPRSPGRGRDIGLVDERAGAIANGHKSPVPGLPCSPQSRTERRFSRPSNRAQYRRSVRRFR